MAVIGYIKLNFPGESPEDSIAKLNNVGCQTVVVEQIEDETERPNWKRMLNKLKRSDTLVVISLSNALRGLRELAAFFELCRIKRVRLISLKDKLDSIDELYPPSTAKFMDVIASLMSEIAIERGASASIRAQKNGTRLGRPIGSTDKQREKLCVELYKGGNSVADIMKETGYRSKSSVFRILRNNGIEPNRRITRKN
jgi:DNA invertase Pin-like site-specific DNA recombinase